MRGACRVPVCRNCPVLAGSVRPPYSPPLFCPLSTPALRRYLQLPAIVTDLITLTGMKKLRSLLFLLSALTYQAIEIPTLSAQEKVEDHAPHTHTCGSDWARSIRYRITPEEDQDTKDNHTFEKKVPLAAEAARIPPVAGGERFFTVRADGKGWQSLTAFPVYKGNDVVIWLADPYYSLLTRETIDRLAVGLEERTKEGPAARNPDQGVIANDIAMFGEPSRDRWSGGKVKVHILLMKIESPINGGNVDGYFSPHDQTRNAGSNERNLLYIDLRPLLSGSREGVDRVLGTIAHEFQHLINHARYKGAYDETHWMYNEGLSEVASIRNGYWSRNAGNSLSAPNRFGYFNAPLAGAGTDTVLCAYERAMLWTYYLAERFGDRFLYELVSASGTGVEPVRTAMRRSGHGDDAENVVADFWAANYLQGAYGFPGGAQYRYQFPLSSVSSGTVPHYLPTGLPRSESVTLLEYAAYYPEYRNEDPENVALRIRFVPGANHYRVNALLYRPDNTVEVQIVNPGEERTFRGFTNAIFAIANVSGSRQKVEWDVEHVSGEAGRPLPGHSLTQGGAFSPEEDLAVAGSEIWRRPLDFCITEGEE